MSILDTDASALTPRRPAVDEARGLVERSIDDGALVTLFGTCTVDYDGRASSRLAAGDRHVMVKPDGTVLVHTGEGHQPVNWQPPGCAHGASVEDGTFVLRSDRSNPEELLVVRFDHLHQVSTFTVRDSADLELTGTHDDVRDRIIEDPDRVEPGFRVLDVERQTSAGAIDLYGEDAEGRPVAVEIKRSRSGPEAVGQLRRYVDALARDLDGAGSGDAGVRGILVAPSATDRALDLLDREGMGFVSIDPAPGGPGA